MTDFNAVRDQILGDKDVRDEDRIEVNQRHLIDKILARYSSEYTVYREVLQNANDAGASSFEIEFHTISNRNNLRSNSLILDKNLNSVDLDIRDSRVTAVTLRNNGRPFDENDWSRLKKIAEGNPDETKVGFFGVGFYSLFSICEEPIVISGEKCLAFYWRGDQLYARSGKAPSSHDSKWTSIHLKIREKDYDFPHPDSFAHFCSKAILFTQFLDGIFVYLYPEVRLKESDENLNVSENSNNNIKELIFSVLKKRAIAQDLSIQPKDTLKNKARTIPNGIFSLTRANCQPIQIDLYKRYTSFHLSSETNSGSLFTSLWTIAKALVKSKAQEAAEKMQKAPGLFSLFLRVINCEVEVNCSSSLVKDMERSTKKRPPKSTKLHLLYRNYDEAQASHDGYDLKIVHPVLEGVLPAIPLIQTGYKNVDQKTIGKLFIGFETHQTTGLGFHIAGPFIPTVERESLDFVDRALAQWNEELLRACGILCRCIYDNEVYLISTLYSHQDLTEELPEDYWKRSNHLLAIFTTFSTSPSQVPGYLIRSEFPNCGKAEILIPSTLGITELSRLRNIPMEVKSFSLGIASFDVERMKNCLDFLNQVLEGRIIPDVTPSEVVEIVGQRDFTISEKAQFLFWISTSPTGSVPFSLFSHIRVPCGTGNLEKLSNVKFCPPDTECDEIPLPEVCLGLEMYLLIPKNIWINFFGLKQLPLVRVAQYAAQKIDGTNVAMAERLLRYIYNKTLGNMVNLDLTEQEVAMVISSLANHSILPVMVSNKDRVVKLLKPNECYLPDVKSFGDVPTATISGVTDEFLISLGVQSHMEVRTIISNLKTLNWSHSKLIKYLATVEDQLSNEEIQSLREARIFPAIDRVNELFCIAELYGPADDSAVNMCGFPVLEWKKGGESVPMRSDAAFFLSRLGMLTYIPLSTLITLISTDSQKRPALLRYLVERFESVYQNQYKAESIKIPFLPISSNYRQDSKSELELALPSDCYTDEGLGLLGFRVLHPQLSSYARMFGVSQRPNADELVHAIIERRFEREKSADLFGYLSSILSTFRASHLNMMSRAEIIYISGNWRAPSTVFFRPGRIALKNFHIIDFGSQSKPFLNACGVQEEPRATQVADRLCTEGQMILDTIGSVAYTDLLRWIALQHDQIKHESPYLFKKMATSICLIGHQFVETCVEIPSATVTSTTFHTALEDEQEVSRIVHTLAKAEDIYVVDDSISMQIFNCTACPNDQLLENFYGRLGCKLLSSTVKQTWEVISTGVKDEQKSNHEVSKLESLIKSRSPLIASEIASTLSSQSKCNETSMLKNLLNVKVSASQSIFVIRSLGRRENRQKTSAATIQDGIINVTVPFNSFDVAVALSKVMTGISGTKMAEALLISTLLMTPLPSLRSMGFAVDRVLAKTTAKSSILTPEDSVLVSNHSNSSNEIKTTAKQNDQVVSGKLADRLSGQGKEMEKYQESIERDDVNNSFLDSSMSSGNRNSFSTSDLSGRNKKIGSETIDTGGGGGGGGGEKGGSGSVFSMTKAWVGKVGERIAKAVNMGPRTPIFDAPGLQGALQNSIRSLKNYGGKPIDNANASINEPGSISQTKVDEESCKIMPGESLIRIGQVRSFTMYATSHEANKIEVGGEILNSFADILETLCTIFKADAGTINIFCNRESRTIAFNRGLTLFFNIAFYERQINRISRKEMLCNWYMTFCHELAHNFVGPHDLQHEFYMSAFAESYLPKLASFL